MTTSTFALKKVKIAEKQVLEKLEHAKKKKVLQEKTFPFLWHLPQFTSYISH